jgi:hypothetical protein
MTKLRTALSLAAVALLLAACGPAPEKVCEHINELTKKDLGDHADAVSDEQFEKSTKNCIERAKKNREKDPKEYSQRAKCVMAADSLEDLRDCEKREKDSK